MLCRDLSQSLSEPTKQSMECLRYLCTHLLGCTDQFFMLKYESHKDFCTTLKITPLRYVAIVVRTEPQCDIGHTRGKKMRYVAIVTGKAYNYKFSECRIPFYVWNSPKYPRSCIPVMGRKSSSTCEKRSIECPYAFEPFLSTSPCHFFPSNARFFFPPLTLMPCDSGRDNQLRVKSPTNDCDH